MSRTAASSSRVHVSLFGLIVAIVAVVTVGALPTIAVADPASADPGNRPAGDRTQPADTISNGVRAYVVTPPEGYIKNPAVGPGSILYLNRCVGNCSLVGSTNNDATAMQSTVPCAGGASCSGGGCTCAMPNQGNFTIHEFTNIYNQTGATGTCTNDGTTPCTTATEATACGTGNTCDTADAEWAALLKCVKEVYSPYAITVTDVAPSPGVSFSEDLVAGTPADIGYAGQPILGISPFPHPGDCSAHDNVLSFSFANAHPPAGKILNLCWTVAQESAHAFGLDHEYMFVNGKSACSDPMTYQVDCGGQKFFRNEPAMCGEYAARPCACTGAQDSHQKLISVFGAGTSIVPVPTASIVSPAAGTVTNGFTTQAQAFSQRGVAQVELWLNGYKWLTQAGAPFGPNGQPQSTYALSAPASVPDGVIDIQVKAYDDIGAEGDSAIVTVTKGVPCVDTSKCATGQKCDAGKCYWDAPTGMIGDACTYPQFCVSGMCEGTDTQKICTTACIVGVADSCPANFDCVQTSGTDGICFTSSSGGGCCSVGHDDHGVWIHGGLGALVLGLALRRRRRRS